MDYVKLFGVAALMSMTMAPFAQAQDEGSPVGTSYPASMAGVDMASIPVGDICQLNGNPGLTAEGQLAVETEIANRPVICPNAAALGTGLAATNAIWIPAGATLLLVAVAAGGGGGTSGTNGTD